MVDTDTTSMETDCLHKAPSDAKFKARMRFHQSWYRRHVLGLLPGKNSSARYALYGNVLRPEDAAAGCNFLTPDIAQYAERRLAEGAASINTARLRGNLLSSQPMCINLFAPLAMDLSLATRLVRTMPGLPDDLSVTDIIVEYAPNPETHLQDKTAFDAWIGYTRPDGVRGFIGVETKLTEPFSTGEYPFDERYARWRKRHGWWWQPGSEEEFPHSRVNQLWRNHLLAFAMLHQHDSSYNEAYSAVLFHDEDSTCTKSIAAYRPLLQTTAQDTLLVWPLAEVVERWQSTADAAAERDWLNSFHERYCDLSASVPAWDAYHSLTA